MTFYEYLKICNESSAKAKAAYLQRRKKRAYFRKTPTAVAFSDPNVPSDTPLT